MAPICSCVRSTVSCFGACADGGRATRSSKSMTRSLGAAEATPASLATIMWFLKPSSWINEVASSGSAENCCATSAGR
ncbi:hypothetical protein D9M69_374740 [compost metagenome]